MQITEEVFMLREDSLGKCSIWVSSGPVERYDKTGRFADIPVRPVVYEPELYRRLLHRESVGPACSRSSSALIRPLLDYPWIYTGTGLVESSQSCECAATMHSAQRDRGFNSQPVVSISHSQLALIFRAQFYGCIIDQTILPSLGRFVPALDFGSCSHGSYANIVRAKVSGARGAVLGICVSGLRR